MPMTKAIDKRLNELEIKAEPIKRQQERQKWRDENSEQLRWEMWLRTWAPGPDGKSSAPEVNEMIARCMKHVNPDTWQEDFDAMTFEERAFWRVLQDGFYSVDDYDMLRMDLDYWAYMLDYKLDLPFQEMLRRIDAYVGSSDWREICFSEAKQKEIMDRLEEENRLLRGAPKYPPISNERLLELVELRKQQIKALHALESIQED